MRNLVLNRLYDTTLLFFSALNKKITGYNSKLAHRYLLSSFYLFGGLLNIPISFFLGSKKLRLPNTGILAKVRPEQLHQALRALRRDGYVVFDQLLSQDQCNSILNESLKIKGKTRMMDGGKGVLTTKFFDRENPNCVRFDYPGSELVSNSIIQELVFDESIAAFAENYLRVAPILDLVTMYWHTTFSDTPDKEAAQWFHFDMDQLRWIKFFFYITDVTPDSGPHTFVAKSHRRLGIPYNLRKRGYKRLSDEEVMKYYPAEDFIEFTGKRGTLIVEDTRGLHKGKHCVNGDRLLLQFEFSASDFGAEMELLHVAGENLTNKSIQTMEKYPYLYQKIRVI